MPRYAPLVTALADRLAARTLELVDIPSESLHERAIREHLHGLVPSPLRVDWAGDEAALFLPVRRPDHPLVLLAGHYDTVPAQENLPGRIADGAVHGVGASDMKGGLAVAIELLRDLVDADPGPVDVGLLLFGREELPADHNPLPAMFAGSEAVRETGLAILLEPTDGNVHAGCLGNVVARLTFHGRSGHSARPWLADSAIVRAVRGLGPLLEIAPRAVVAGGLEFREVVSVTRLDAGIADNVIPGTATATLNLRYAPDRTPEEAEEHLRSLVPDGADARTREHGAGRKGRYRIAPRRVAPPRREPRRRAEAGLDERRGLHRERDRRRELRTRPHRVRAPCGRARPHRGSRPCVRGASGLRHRTGPRGYDVMETAGRIDELWESGELDPEPIEQAIALLDSGEARVAEKRDGDWVVNEWTKKAILLYFRLRKVEPIEVGGLHFLDKIPVKSDYARQGVRVVPPGVARYGSFLAEGVVLMPGYVNIGARVGPRTMVDTWATVGSCAQIGADVHLSGGVGIGGVLEPPQARPVIVEDGAFIGSRAVVVEGVVVGEGAVIAPNVVLSASIPIIDVTGAEPVEHRGHVPPRSVVLPGTRPKDFPAGRYDLPCALIVGERSASTDLKTSLNDVLREFEIAS